MILRKLHVQRFRALDDFETELGPGLNVLRGPNEAGKSTLQSAIATLLFRDPGAKNRAIEEMRSWGNETLPVLRAEITTPAQEYSLAKDFENHSAELTLPDGTVLSDRKQVEARLAEIAGCGSEDVYLATACLPQQQWARVMAGAELREVLQGAFTGGAEGAEAQDILSKLDRAIRDLERGTKRHAQVNPGALAQARRAREQVEEELSQARVELGSLEQARLTLDMARGEADELREELARLTELEKRVAQYFELERDAGELRQHADSLAQRLEIVERLDGEIRTIEEGLAEGPQVDQQFAADVASWAAREEERAGELAQDAEEVRKLEENRKRLEAEVTDTSDVERMQEDVDRCRHLERHIAQAGTEAAENAREAAEVAEQIAEGRRHIAPRKLLLVLGALLAVAGLALTFVSPLAAALAVVGLVCVAFGLYLRVPAGWNELPTRLEQAQGAQAQAEGKLTTYRDQLAELLTAAQVDDVETFATRVETAEHARIEAKANLENVRSNTAVLRQRMDERKAVVGALRERLQEALESTGMSSLDRLIEEADARDKARRLLRDKQQQREGALGGQTIDELRSKYRDLSLELHGIQAKLKTPEIATAQMSPEDYQKLNSRIGQARIDLESEEQKARQAETTIAAARYDSDMVKALDGRAEQLARREEMLVERLEAWTLARDVIGEARDQTLAAVTEAIAPRMGELLSELTGHRYGEITLSSDMTPQVTCPETGRRVQLATNPTAGASGLSCATREQVFLAARLAIVDMLWPEGGPPMLLDDPLVNFDPERRQAAVEAISSAAKTHQVLLFTCLPDYDAVADRIIEMPGPK